jgi:tetratricopeptide (TPR) repeat protein
MQEAREENVLGDFDDARFEHRGVVSTFSRRDGRFFVNTEGPDGKLADFEIAWTFGVDPLQQYLVRFPRGHVQALGIAWDSRPSEAGGQRWFSLYPDEHIPPGDVLHWTKLSQRWNAQCAACHSTNLRKGYDLDRDAYQTTWSDLNVACEACHGPGSRHVEWAEAGARGEAKGGDVAGRGLPNPLPRHEPEDWVLEPGAPIAHRRTPRSERTELETCAPCHARRSLLREEWTAGEPLLDGYRPALLAAGLYDDVGQMRDEVYEYGSFVQSPMHAAGVTCSDCHDPHSLALRAEGNAACGQCHRAEVFDARSHHHHEPGSPGAACVACHMPARTYMVIDVRHDHSFRVPRPDLSVELGAPDACTDCHAGRSARWAAGAVAAWFPNGRAGTPHFGEALHAGRHATPGAGRALATVASDEKQPGIVRGSALSELAAQGGAVGSEPVQKGLADPDPLVRLGALDAAEGLEPGARLGLVAKLLRDPVRAVRAEAGRLLASVPASLWRPTDRAALADALAEYRAAQAADADRPEAHVNLGILHLSLGETDAARREYETALRVAPWFVPAYVNLADLERGLGRDDAAETSLRRGLAIAPGNPDLEHALGLALVRLGRREEALAALEQASKAAPDRARYAFAYALALHDAGDVDRALAVLAEAQKRRPGDRGLLVALVTLSRDAGRTRDAVRYARALVEAFPDDREARAFLAELEAGSS